MTECDNAEIRDLLPDFVSETLSSVEQRRVEEHVASCIACVDETALLRAMRAATPAAPSLDIARIVNALPQHQPTLRIIPRERAAPSVRARRPLAGVWRAAAAIGVAVIGSWSVSSYLLGGSAQPGEVTSVAVGAPARDSLGASTVTPVAASETIALADTPRATPASAASTRTGASESALSLGDLSDYSDDDLQRMLDRLDKWDGATSTEPVPTVPIIPVTERGTL